MNERKQQRRHLLRQQKNNHLIDNATQLTQQNSDNVLAQTGCNKNPYLYNDEPLVQEGGKQSFASDRSVGS